MEALLTFDVGTSGTKCTLFGSDGREVASETSGHRIWFPSQGWAEQDADDFWKACVEAGRKVLAASKGSGEARSICAIGLAGQMNGCLALDGSGSPLLREIIHSDTRSGAQCAAILDRMPNARFYELTGNRVDPHFSLPKIMWIRDNLPQVYSRAAFFVNAKDYIAFKLTGTLGTTDFSDASLTTALDLGSKSWASGLLAEVGLDESKFPRCVKSAEKVGALSAGAAAALGLPSGIPVVAGGGDAACATRGAGVVDDGCAYANIGSSAWISTLAARPLADAGMRMQNFFDLDGELLNICGTVQTASSACDWAFREMFADAVDGGVGRRADLELEIVAAEVGSHGVLFAPYLMGERTPWWDESIRGAFVGLSMSTKRADLLRSVIEGVAFALRTVLGVYGDSGFRFGELRLLGGAAMSPAWLAVIRDALGIATRLHAHPLSGTSLGAAMAAGVGVGLFPDFRRASAMASFADRREPDPASAPLYDRYYAEASRMYERLRPICANLLEIERERRAGKESAV